MLDEIDVYRGTKECAGAGSGKSEQDQVALSNGSRLSCGRLARQLQALVRRHSAA